MNYSPHTKSELLELIERYFECSLSDAEESALREEIALTGYRHAAIDEARAAMGFRKRRHAPTRHRSLAVRYVTGVAASLVLALAMYTVNLLLPGISSGGDMCVAYADGHVTMDEDTVLSLLAMNLEEFNAEAEMTSHEFQSDLADMINLIDHCESDIFLPEI